MFNSFLLRLHQFAHRFQSFEQSLFRQDIVVPFLVVRLALMAAMLLGFYFAFSTAV